jgi:V-type H+-transporting ATPase subunit a
VFTIVTFPFEFGVMFGDVGHGLMLLIAASFMIYMERHWEGKKINEMIEMVYGGRYTIFLMALFSVYIGALYNELFALPMNFGSNWWFVNLPPYNTFRPVDFNWYAIFYFWKLSRPSLFFPPSVVRHFRFHYSVSPPFPSCHFFRCSFVPSIYDFLRTYPFGVDPVWKGATNELTFYNSLKMKTSVIIGVCQVCGGERDWGRGIEERDGEGDRGEGWGEGLGREIEERSEGSRRGLKGWWFGRLGKLGKLGNLGNLGRLIP